MNHSGLLKGLALAIALAVAGVARPAPSAQTLAAASSRPVLQRQQGPVFAYSLPAGWRANATANGLDIAAPDGVTGVSASFVFGMFGVQSPEGHFQKILATLPLTRVHIKSRVATPPAPGPLGLAWQGVEIEFTALSRGQPIYVRAISHVLQGSGQYSAMLTGIQGPLAQWDALRLWLPQVRDAIAIINASVAAGSMTRGLPRGIRHDEVYGNYNQAWTARGVTADRISAARREGTMGYTRQQDPLTGQIYDTPLEAYDASRGGYVNPVRPTELLVSTAD